MLRGATVIKEGKITWPPPPPTLSVGHKPLTEAPAVVVKEEKKTSLLQQLSPMIIGGLLLLALGAVAPITFMEHFTVFVLACFLGYQVIWNVTPSLHTPLMSVTNAISGIIVVGALVQISSTNTIVMALAGISILIASINIGGGFLVTRRMLEMFRK